MLGFSIAPSNFKGIFMKIFLILNFIFLYVFSTLARTNSPIKIDVLHKSNQIIWGFDFLPDERIIFSERSGGLKLFNFKNSQLIHLTHNLDLFVGGQGGLLDVRVHPEYRNNNWIYLSYSKKNQGGSATALARFELRDSKIYNLTEIFVAKASGTVPNHFGGRIEFTGDGHLFLSVGEHYERDKAQDLTVHNGKILRLNEDGSVPSNNPFIGNENKLPEIWSYGHRNPQGLFWDSKSKKLFEAEFGPMGGDELNEIVAGGNYGWPLVTYGVDYNGDKIGDGTEKPGIIKPITYWTPSISPSALTRYYGDKIPEWKGSFFLACLSGLQLRRVEMKGSDVTKQEILFAEKKWRFRNIRTGLDGWLYFSTDTGHLGRIIK